MALVTSPLGKTGNRGSLWSSFLSGSSSSNLTNVQSGAINIMGQISSAIQQRNQREIEYTAAGRSLDFNIAMAEHEKWMYSFNEEIETERFRNKFRGIVGEATAAGGSSGFALSSEATQKAIDDIVRSGELDAAIIRMNGDVGRWKATMDILESKYQKKRLSMQKSHEKRMQIAKTVYSIANTALSSYNTSSMK